MTATAVVNSTEERILVLAPRGRDAQVIAQVLDYAASLSTYEERDLVRLFAPEMPEKARLVDVVRRFFPTAEASSVAAALLRRVRSSHPSLPPSSTPVAC